VLALTLVFSAELFHHVLGAIWKSIGHHLDESARHAHRMGSAAVCVAIGGSLLAIGLVFGQRLLAMFAG
jgi:diacylglycerol kinase